MEAKRQFSCSSSLEEIATSSHKFLEEFRRFTPHKFDIERVLEANEENSTLLLPDVDSYHYRASILGSNLSPSLSSSFLHLYDRLCEDSKRVHESHWIQLFSCCLNFNTRTTELLARSFHKSFVESAKEIQARILQNLDKCLEKFRCDAEASALSDIESSSEDALLVPRGHSKLAITILEKAYARTTNITRAEKLRLAAATKLEPRQVTIWFQNRRNRKTAATQAQAVEEGTGEGKSRKRKAEGLYGGEARRPSQRTRTSTPDSSPSSSRDVYLNGTLSASSLASSIDSLAQWSRGKERNYSSDSSVLGDPALPSSFDGNSEGSVPHFNDSHLVPSFSFDSQVGENFSSSMLFSDAGVVQLDFDDLGLDLNSLVEELPSFGMDAFDFMPAPSALVSHQPTNIHFDLNETPRQSSFAVSDLPSTALDVASTLAVSPVDATVEMQRAQQIEEWAFGMGDVLDGDCDDGWYISLQGLSSADTTSPSSGTMSLDTNSNVATPTDASDVFDFSFQGLAIDHIMQENHASFGGKDPMGGHRTFRLDIEAANRNGSVSVVEPASG